MPQFLNQFQQVWSMIGLDGALLILAVISGVLAMYRGMTRELLTIVNWVVAAFVAYLLFRQSALAESLGQQYGQNPKLVQIGLAVLGFFGSLIVMYLITGRVADRILDSRVGMIDRILGFAFGAARGALLVVIAFTFYTKFFPIEKGQEARIPNARSLPYVQAASDKLSNALEPLVADLMKKFGKGAPEGDDQPQDRGGQQRGSLEPGAKSALALAR